MSENAPDNEPWKNDPDRPVTPWEEKEALEDAIDNIGRQMDPSDGSPSTWYKLVDRVPVPIKFSEMLRELQAASDPAGPKDQYPDLREKLGYWARVAETEIPLGRFFPWGPRKALWVSTVFLGKDHSFHWNRDVPYQPVLFETMVFWRPGDFGDLDMDRYCTWAEVEAGHAAMVAKVTREYSHRGRVKLTCRQLKQAVDDAWPKVKAWFKWAWAGNR